MRNKIIAAKVLAEDNDIEINRLLRKAIMEGWELQGGVSSSVIDGLSYKDVLVVMYEDES